MKGVALWSATQSADVDAAARRIAEGGLVAFATETVYGLGANAENEGAIAQIFATKGRPADHPLIVHVVGVAQVAHFARDVPAFAERLLAAFWPGPLTLILPRRAGVASASAGGQDSIGLRAPSHPAAQALLLRAFELGVHGISAPSANRFGRVSPTTAAHVLQEFGEGVPVLDGGACTVGVESSIVDCTRGAPVLLRPGMITRERLTQACGQSVLLPEEVSQAQPKASGTLEQHYAPTAKLRVMSGAQLQAALDVLADSDPDGQAKPTIAVYARSAIRLRTQAAGLRRMPQDAAATAQQLFAVLRSFDDAGAKLIWVEEVPETEDWAAVADRLRRAAA